MILKVTKRNLKWEIVIACGDGDAHHLLQGLRRIGYNSGVYGWNYSVYAFDGIVLATGYRTDVGAQVEYLKDYEKRAKKIFDRDNNLDYDERMKKVSDLRRNFAKRVMTDVREGKINYVV